jgi:hypothetical protein
LKHPLVPGTDPAPPPSRWPSGSTELEALPATCRQAANRATPTGCRAFNFRPAIVLYVRHTTLLSTGKATACPRVAKKRRRTEVSVPLNGSPGAVGRHNNTPNRIAFGWRCRKHPASGACRHVAPADAMRFAIEELPPERPSDGRLGVEFDRGAIRRLYDSDQYPLARRAATCTRTAVE